MNKKSRLMRGFNSLKMELGEDPKKFPMRVGRVARELRRVGKAIDEDEIKPRYTEQTHGNVCRRAANAGGRGRWTYTGPDRNVHLKPVRPIAS